MLGKSILQRWKRRVLLGSVLVVTTTATYLAVSVLRNPVLLTAASARFHESKVREATRGPLVNPFASANGTHLIAFVITASDCGWSQRPSMMEAMGSLRSKLRTKHGANYAQVSVIGVALDEDLDAGLRFLSQLGKGKPGGAFDQVVVGGSWLNEQIVRFVWRDSVAEAASPQVIVIERPVNTESYLSTFTIGIKNDRVVTNRTGREIFEWISDGLPVDSLTKSLEVALSSEGAAK
jgi:hypothetical protein